MYAIVDIAGQQFKVEKDQKIYVHRLDAAEGKKVSFDRVLLIDDNGKVNVGAPAIDGAQVSATVLEHLKGDKVIVFKKKRRKGYQKKNGHRQLLTEIQVNDIKASGATKAAAKGTTSKASGEPKKEEATGASPKKTTATGKKAEAPKKQAAPKKEAAPKKQSSAKAEKPSAKAEKTSSKETKGEDKAEK